MQNRGLYVAAGLFVLALGAFYVYDKGIGGNPAGAGPTASPVVLASPVVGLDPTRSRRSPSRPGQVLTSSRSASGYNYALPDGPGELPPAAGRQHSGRPAVHRRGPAAAGPHGLWRVGPAPQLRSRQAQRRRDHHQDRLPGHAVTLGGGKAPDNISDYVRKPTRVCRRYAIPAASIDGPLLAWSTTPRIPQPTPSAQPRRPVRLALPGPAGPPGRPRPRAVTPAW